MKKVLRFTIFILVLVLITGCGINKEKKLVCTIDSKPLQEYTITFKFDKNGNKMKDVEKVIIFEYDSEDDAKWKYEICKKHEHVLDEFHITQKIKLDGEKVIITMTADVDKVDAESFYAEFDVKLDSTYDDIKEYFESNSIMNYRCE